MPVLEIVGLGYCSWDYLGIVSSVPPFDSPTVSMADFAASAGGPASTALAAAARLGASTGFIGTVGDDEPGCQIRAALSRDGVDLQRMRLEGGARTPVCLVLVEGQSGRRTILCYRGTPSVITLGEQDRTYVQSSRFLHLDGHHLAAAIVAARWMHEIGGTVVLDANKPREGLDQLLPWVNVLITNQYFPQAFTGHERREDAANALMEMGPQIVVTTLGQDGCVCFTSDRNWHSPGFVVPVVDTTGAGDAFHGAFVFGMLQGWAIERAAQLANAVAALNCTALGGRAALPTLQQALALVDAVRDRTTQS